MIKMLIQKILNSGIIILLLFPTTVFSFISDSGKPCPDIVVSGTNLNCYGQNSGTASVTVANGSGNYTYNWSNGENTGSIAGLTEGTYTVTVKDNVSGCSVTGAYVVTSPDPITLKDFEVHDVKCYGENTGRIDITPKGGAGSYTYNWVNGSMSSVAGNSTLNNVYADNYSVTVKDTKGCTYNRTFLIKQPHEALAGSADITNAACFGGSSGAIDLTIWGGTPSYKYTWNIGATSEDLNTISNGSYSVEVEDLNGCKIDLNFFVSQPTPLSGIMSSTNVDCYGENTGSVHIDVQGGTLPYSFSWNNLESVFSEPSATLNNVIASDYRVIVKDKNDCEFIGYATVYEPTELVVNHSFQDINCYGGSDGRINLTVSGATPNYSFEWRNENNVLVGSNNDLMNVPAGIYTAIVKDANNCQKIITQELKQPSYPIQVVESIENVKCYGQSTGSIGLHVTGGTEPYTYNWSTLANTSSIENLPAGVYTYQITDFNSCTYSNQVSITQPSEPLTASFSKTDVNCYGESNGKIYLTINGGTSPYSYEWNNSAFSLSNISNQLINYPADFYTYHVKDAYDCSISNTIEIEQPTLLQSDISGVDILCKGGNNGSVNLTPTGGVPPYQFSWNNFQVTEDLNHLTAGHYEVQIKDQHNCISLNGITLNEPADSLSYEYEKEDVLCYDGNNGKISILVHGGVEPYAYQWSNGDTLSTAKQLTAGNHSFLVTDHNGCLLSDTIEIYQPDELLLNADITPVSCNGMNDGQIDITPVGGTEPYEFKWFNSNYVLSAQTEDLDGFPADVYQVEIVDSNNCFNEAYFTLSEPDVLEITYSTDIVTCHGEGNGSIFVQVHGGNPAYNFNWSTGATTQDLIDIPAGQYHLLVTDQKNCKDSIEVDITQPEPIELSFETTPISCMDQHDGMADVYAQGGNGGYLYNWSTGDNTSHVEDLDAKLYVVDVIDVLGCHVTDSVRIPSSDLGCVNPVNTFTPNGDNYNDTWIIDNLYLYPEVSVKIFNKWGNLVYNQLGEYEPWTGQVNGANLPSDVYYYIINLNKENREPLIGNITIIR